jgi:hypothetical protein
VSSGHDASFFAVHNIKVNAQQQAAGGKAAAGCRSPGVVIATVVQSLMIDLMLLVETGDSALTSISRAGVFTSTIAIEYESVGYG